MPEQHLQRKLAAILHADVVGSTALVHQDERLAHQRISGAFTRFAETISAYGGVAHEVRGDALVAEFERVSDAVCAALAFQAANTAHNAALADAIRPEIRVGVSLGEVVVAGGTLTGAGVVMAQRVEQLAEPNGVCITGAVHEALPQRLPLDQVSLGEHFVKGFEEPVRVYRVALKPGEAVPEAEASRGGRAALQRPRVIAAVATFALILAGGLAWWLEPWAPREEPASMERMAYPLPDEPSIAVLPFANMSGDSRQEYVSDGLTESIITTLSAVPGVFVIARNSSFSYKGQPVKIPTVAEELGVRYVVEGSYQREGDQIRIHAQLIDALSGRHLWTQRFDRTFAGIFALQDDIAQKVVSSLSVKLSEQQKAGLAKRYTTNIDAYDEFLQGQFLHSLFTKEDNARAREKYQRAIGLDPGFARALGSLAMTHALDFRFNWSADTSHSLRLALSLAEKAVELDPSLPQTQWVLGQAAVYNGDFDRAVAAYEQSIDLDPNYADAYVALGGAYTLAGNPGETLPLLDKAIRLSPAPNSIYSLIRGRALFFLGRFDEARTVLESAVERNPNNLISQVYLTATYAQLGRREDAEWQAAQVVSTAPDFAISTWSSSQILADDAHRARLADGLRRAGLPERAPGAPGEKPSIAVLPFANMSNEPEQDYFSDGITEDIITDLSQISNIGVIARNSSFGYRDSAVNIQDIANELGVGYVLTGSLRRVGDRVRINAQLVDAASGRSLWADRYDRMLVDILDLQDDIRKKIVSSLSIELMGEEEKNLSRRQTSSFKAYDLFLQGRREYSEFSFDGLKNAESLYRQAIELDPEFARAYGALGITLCRQLQVADTDLDRTARLARALEAVETAVRIEPTSPQVQWALGYVRMTRGEFRQAAEAVEESVSISPNYADGWGLLALINNQLGRGDQALRFIRKGMALNPGYSFDYPYNEGRALYNLGEYEKAVAPLLQALERNENAWNPRLYLVASYVRLGRLEDAEWEVSQLEISMPGISLSHLEKEMPMADGDHRIRFFEDLRAAGLSD